MSMQRQKTEYRMGTGATSLLMIFIVLCLTTLSILALTTARNDLKMSNRAVEWTRDYYQATDRVQGILSELDAQLSARQAQEPEDEYFAGLEGVAVDGVDLDYNPAERRLAFSVDAGEDRYLRVEIECLSPGDGARYRVVKHEMRYKNEWEIEFNRELFMGSGEDMVTEDSASGGSIADLEDMDNLEWID